MNKKWLKVIVGLIVLIMLVIACGCSCTNESTSDQTQSNATVNEGDNTPPILSVTQPADNSTTNTRTVIVAGTTEAGANVSVNDIDVSVSEGGAFNTSADLAPGANRITVIATDNAGNATTQVINVTYVQQTQSTTTTTQP